MRWMEKLRQSIKEQKTLEDRFFAVVVIVGLTIVTVSEVVTFIEDIGYIANIGTAIGGVMLLIVIFEAYIRKRIDIARVMLCYAFNCIVIPIAFFSCGGIDSGMPLYMLAGIFTLVPVLKGKHRVICLIISFAVDIVCMAISYYLMQNPDGFVASKLGFMPSLSMKSRFIDMVCSLLLICLYVIITTALIMDAYQKERTNREALLIKLDDLSKRDALTGLYNRRELFRYLEEMQAMDENTYLCMLDIDHFKKVNDTYGHVFGDVVLRTLAGIMAEEVRDDEGETVGRYGGEEFLIVIHSESKAGAVERIERIRKRFEQTEWESHKDFKTSFSAGMVCCGRFKSYVEAISRADKDLYKAKESGRNRVISED